MNTQEHLPRELGCSDCFFVSRSLRPPFGAISRIGIWLSLTFAIAFHLVGVGQYLSEFLPIAPLRGAMAVGILLTALNIIGASHEWRIRNVLFGYIPNIVADFAQCSVLMVSRYLLEH